MIEEVAPGLRKAFPQARGAPEVWVQSDNAGGHGTIKDRAEIVDTLWSKFKIKVVWQPAQSPDLNVLDLGLWRSLSTAVDKLNKSKRDNVDALWQTCEKSFEDWGKFNEGEESVIQRVYTKLDAIADFVIESGGDNAHEHARAAGAKVGSVYEAAEDVGVSDEDEATSGEED